jgi:hypothetical protein
VIVIELDLIQLKLVFKYKIVELLGL